MTLLEMRTAVRTRLGRPASDNFFTDAVLTDIINEAILKIGSDSEWPWMQTNEDITTIAATQAYDPADDWNFTRMMYIDNFTPIVYVPIERLVEYTGIGQPQVYSIFENQIWFGPTPDSAYVIHHFYYQIEPTLSGDSDVPILPPQFAYAAVEQALVFAYTRSNQMDMIQAAQTSYGSWLEVMQNFKRRSAGPNAPKTFRTFS